MNKKKVLMIGLALLAGFFILSLFVIPLLHPDHKVTKIGIITNVTASGNPYFRDTVYTLSFQDGEVLRLQARNSVPIPVGKPVAVTYSAREQNLLGVKLAKSEVPVSR